MIESLSYRIMFWSDFVDINRIGLPLFSFRGSAVAMMAKVETAASNRRKYIFS